MLEFIVTAVIAAQTLRSCLCANCTDVVVGPAELSLHIFIRQFPGACEDAPNDTMTLTCTARVEGSPTMVTVWGEWAWSWREGEGEEWQPVTPENDTSDFDGEGECSSTTNSTIRIEDARTMPDDSEFRCHVHHRSDSFSESDIKPFLCQKRGKKNMASLRTLRIFAVCFSLMLLLFLGATGVFIHCHRKQKAAKRAARQEQEYKERLHILSFQIMHDAAQDDPPPRMEEVQDARFNPFSGSSVDSTYASNASSQPLDKSSNDNIQEQNPEQPREVGSNASLVGSPPTSQEVPKEISSNASLVGSPQTSQEVPREIGSNASQTSQEVPREIGSNASLVGSPQISQAAPTSLVATTTIPTIEIHSASSSSLLLQTRSLKD